MKHLIFLILLAGCGKAPDNPAGPTIQGRSLEKLTTEEVLSIKYLIPPELKCVLHIQPGQNINLNVDPIDEFVWPVQGKAKVYRFLNFGRLASNELIVIKAGPELTVHERLSFVNFDGSDYEMEFSPTMKLMYRRVEKNSLRNGALARMTFHTVTLHENVEQPLYRATTRNGPRYLTEDVRCVLSTKPRAAYKNQWRRIR
jgi:hypothetical protein